MSDLAARLRFTVGGDPHTFQQLAANNFIIGEPRISLEAPGVDGFGVIHQYSGHVFADLPVKPLKSRPAFQLELMRGRNLLRFEPSGEEMSLYYKSGARDWVESILKAFIILLVIQTFVVQTFFIPTGSMKNTLFPGDYIMVEKLTYRSRAPEPGEIIVFEYPEDVSKDFIKRLIAKGGDQIYIEGGVVQRNGVKMPERYTVFKKHLLDPSLLSEAGGIEFDLRMPTAFAKAPGTKATYIVRLRPDLAAIGDLEVDSVEQAELALERLEARDSVDETPGSFHFDRESLEVRIHPRGSVPLPTVARQTELYFRFRHVTDPQVARLERRVFGETRNFEKRTLRLPDEDLWAMGDNRNNSSDSRFWSRRLRKRGVMGKALLVYWPPSHMGMIRHMHLDRPAGDE